MYSVEPLHFYNLWCGEVGIPIGNLFPVNFTKHTSKQDNLSQETGITIPRLLGFLMFHWLTRNFTYSYTDKKGSFKFESHESLLTWLEKGSFSGRTPARGRMEMTYSVVLGVETSIEHDLFNFGGRFSMTFILHNIHISNTLQGVEMLDGKGDHNERARDGCRLRLVDR